MSEQKIIQGDCLDKLKELEPNSVDSIVTDPPYGLEFMGKDWDAPWKGKASKEFSDIPEGSLGGFRHLPQNSRVNNLKCLNCDKWKFSSNPCKCASPLFPNARGMAMVEFQRWFTPISTELLRVAKPGAYLLSFGGTRTFHRLTCAIEDAGWEIRDCVMWTYGVGFPKSHNLKGEWQGWGTSLKPSWEPIIVARKPLEGTVADNVKKYGTGAMNIDGSRVGTTKEGDPNRFVGQVGEGRISLNAAKYKDSLIGQTINNNQGRWPANLIHDGSEEVVGLFPNESARFFYCPKASKSDRDEGLPEGQRSNHPTVKPTALMRYLCKLVTRPGGVVLDPFMGSGSTGKAAKLEGFDFIGIEKEEEYLKIAEARIAAVKQQDKLL